MLLGTRTNLGDFFVELWAVHHRKSVKTLRGCARVLQRQWTSIGNNSPYSLVGCYPGNPLGGTRLRPRCSKTQSPHFRAGTALRCWILCLRKLLYFPSFHKNVKIHSYTVLNWERQNVIMWRSEDPNNQRRALWGQCSLFLTAPPTATQSISTLSVLLCAQEANLPSVGERGPGISTPLLPDASLEVVGPSGTLLLWHGPCTNTRACHKAPHVTNLHTHQRTKNKWSPLTWEVYWNTPPNMGLLGTAIILS